MEKSMGFVLLIIFCVFLTHVLAPTAMGDVELPEWSIGNKWKYKSTEPNVTVNLTIEVLNKTSVNVNGTGYIVYEVENVLEMTTPGMTFTGRFDNYILQSNLTTVKSKATYTVLGGTSHTIVTTYEPPKKDYDFPLTVGKTWASNYTEKVYEKDWGYSNFTVSMNYTVIGEESVTVEAGTFECYKIKVDDGFGNINYNWYSPEVSNIVKTTGGTETIPSAMELTSYSYRDNGEKTNGITVPYLLLLILIVIVIIVLSVVIWRRRKRKE